MMKIVPNRRWLLISGLIICFAGWFTHFGGKTWLQLIESPDRIAPLLSSVGALLMRHFGGKIAD